MNDLEAREHITRALAGDQDAYTALFNMLRPLVERVAWKFFQATAKNEDFQADAVSKVLLSLGKFSGDAKFSTWATAVALNVAREMLRHDRCRAHGHAVSFDEPVGEGESLTIGSMVADPADHFARVEARIDAGRLLANVSPVQRDQIVEKFIHGWTHEEIAAARGTTEGCSKSNAYRGLRLARERMDTPRRHAVNDLSMDSQMSGDGATTIAAAGAREMPFAPRVCICGCGETFTPTGARHIFVFGHRMPQGKPSSAKKGNDVARRPYIKRTAAPPLTELAPRTAAASLAAVPTGGDGRLIELRVPVHALDKLLMLLTEPAKIKAVEEMLAGV